jgi:hypothetical protein
MDNERERHPYAAGEVIRVGIEGARILQVGPKLLEYIDQAGQRWFIDLEESARNWPRSCDQQRAWYMPFGPPTQEEEEWYSAQNVGCVGMRGLRWVEFMNEQKTRFEFPTYEDRCRQLINQLFEFGWHTFDMD